MRKLTVILLFVVCSVSAQDKGEWYEDLFIEIDKKVYTIDEVFGIQEIYYYEFNTKIGAKIVQKRFDLAVIGKDIHPFDCVQKRKKQKCRYLILYDENDENEYFKLYWIKIYCLPKKLRENVEKRIR